MSFPSGLLDCPWPNQVYRGTCIQPTENGVSVDPTDGSYECWPDMTWSSGENHSDQWTKGMEKLKILEEMKMMQDPRCWSWEVEPWRWRFQFPMRKTMRHRRGNCSPLNTVLQTWRGSWVSKYVAKKPMDSWSTTIAFDLASLWTRKRSWNKSLGDCRLPTADW